MAESQRDNCEAILRRHHTKRLPVKSQFLRSRCENANGEHDEGTASGERTWWRSMGPHSGVETKRPTGTPRSRKRIETRENEFFDRVESTGFREEGCTVLAIRKNPRTS